MHTSTIPIHKDMTPIHKGMKPMRAGMTPMHTIWRLNRWADEHMHTSMELQGGPEPNQLQDYIYPNQFESSGRLIPRYDACSQSEMDHVDLGQHVARELS